MPNVEYHPEHKKLLDRLARVMAAYEIWTGHPPDRAICTPNLYFPVRGFVEETETSVSKVPRAFAFSVSMLFLETYFAQSYTVDFDHVDIDLAIANFELEAERASVRRKKDAPALQPDPKI